MEDKKMEEFTVKKEDLQDLFDPKSVKKLKELGGLQGIAKAIKADLVNGLPNTPEENRSEYFGRNVLPEQPQKSIFQLMWEAMHDKTLIMLCVAAVVSLAIGLYTDFEPNSTSTEPHYIEGVAIIVAVLVVVMVQSLNDFQKERQFRKLNAKKDDRVVKVLRGGQTIQLSVYDILVGDVLLLEPGDVISVDGILIEGSNLKSDESSATGESDLIRKQIYVEGSEQSVDPFLLSGGKITEGVGKFMVCCVGVNSFNGKLMMNLRVPTEDTPLQVKLDHLAESIAKIGASVSLLLLIILIIKYFVSEAINGFDSGATIFAAVVSILIQAIVIIVVAVPEGLPLAVTIALAYGTGRMLNDNNLVRVLSACETMGNATAVCSDKTGTLTQNKMTVVAGYVGAKTEFRNDDGIKSFYKASVPEGTKVMEQKHKPESLQGLTSLHYNHLTIEAIVQNSTAFLDKDESGKSVFVGSKTETALLEWCMKVGMDDYSLYKKESAHRVVQVYPFSSERKCMSTVVRYDNVIRIYTKGASEIVLRFCDQVMKQDGDSLNSVPLTDTLKSDIQKKIVTFAEESLRTIIVACRDMPLSEFQEIVGSNFEKGQMSPEATEKLEKICMRNLTMLALYGIEDPLRPGVEEAVRKCQMAGVFVRMVTGDNVNTAKAIATKCGIYTKGGLVMEGPKFRRLNNEQLEEVIPRLQVLARSSPGDKQILVGKLKAMGETVAVTGDGTNDAPALKMADVGFSMGIAGTEVAKEASAIILMDDNFSSILKAMMWGRSINDSVKKFLQFQLTVNISAVTIAFVSAISSSQSESVLTAVQLLWVNLIMDSLGALALATDPPTEEILDRQPDSKKDPLIDTHMWKMILGQSAFQIVVNLLLLYAGAAVFKLDLNVHDQEVQLYAFIFNTFIFLQLFNQINCRSISSNINIFKGLTKNYFFIPIMIVVVIAQVLIILFGGEVFSTTPITGPQWAASVLIGLLTLPIGLVIRLLPTSDGCVICGVPIAKKDQSRVAMTKSRLQWQHAIGSVKTQISVFKTLRGNPRHSTQSNNSLAPSDEDALSLPGTPDQNRRNNGIQMLAMRSGEKIPVIREESTTPVAE